MWSNSGCCCGITVWTNFAKSKLHKYLTNEHFMELLEEDLLTLLSKHCICLLGSSVPVLYDGKLFLFLWLVRVCNSLAPVKSEMYVLFTNFGGVAAVLSEHCGNKRKKLRYKKRRRKIDIHREVNPVRTAHMEEPHQAEQACQAAHMEEEPDQEVILPGSTHGRTIPWSNSVRQHTWKPPWSNPEKRIHEVWLHGEAQALPALQSVRTREREREAEQHQAEVQGMDEHHKTQHTDESLTTTTEEKERRW